MKEVKTQYLLEMLQPWTSQSCSDQGLRRGCHSRKDGGDDERQEVPEEIRSLLRERVLLRGGHGGHDQDDGDDGGHAVLGQSVHQGVQGPHQGELDEHGVKHVEWKMNNSLFSAFWDLLDICKDLETKEFSQIILHLSYSTSKNSLMIMNYSLLTCLNALLQGYGQIQLRWGQNVPPPPPGKRVIVCAVCCAILSTLRSSKTWAKTLF